MGEFDIVVTGPVPVLDQLCVLLRENGRLVRAEPVRAAEEPYAHGSFVFRVTAPGAGRPTDAVDTDTADADKVGADRAGAAASGERSGVLVGLFRSGARHRVTRGGRHRGPRDTRPPSRARLSAPGAGRRAARGGDAGLPQWQPVVDSVVWPPFFTETALPPPVAAVPLRLPAAPWRERRRARRSAARDTAAAQPHIPGPRTVDNDSRRDEHTPDHAADLPTHPADHHPADHVTGRPPAEPPTAPPTVAPHRADPSADTPGTPCPTGTGRLLTYERTNEHEALDRLYAAIGSLRALARTYRGATLDEALALHGLRPASLGLTPDDVAYFDALTATNPALPDAAITHVRRLRGPDPSPAPSPGDPDPRADREADPRSDPLAQRRTDTGAHRRPRRRRDGGPR